MDGKIEPCVVVAAAACLLTLIVIAVLAIIGSYGAPGQEVAGGISRNSSGLGDLIAVLRRIISR